MLSLVQGLDSILLIQFIYHLFTPNQLENYIAINKALWAARTQVHLQSGFYEHGRFLAEFHNGYNSLREIELALFAQIGGLDGKDVMHLQCHFGQDTLSLTKLGSKVTGLDFSPEAITEARRAADILGVKATFVEADVCDIPAEHYGQYDVVFSSYGTIGWLPDLDRWAAQVAALLRPGGHFVFVEFHPVVWMFDDNLEKVIYTYHKSDPIVETEEATYADNAAQINLPAMTWNHGLAEVITALGKHLPLRNFQEYNYSPYGIFAQSVEVSPGRFQPAAHAGRLPLVYSLVMGG